MNVEPIARDPAALAGNSPQSAKAEPSLSALVGQLTDDARFLVRQELEIAKSDATKSAKAIAISGAFIAVGALLLLVGIVVLTVFLIIALGALLGDRYWLSTLIIGGLFAVAGAIALLRGRKGLRGDSLKPRAAIATLKESKEWASSEAAELKRDLSR